MKFEVGDVILSEGLCGVVVCVSGATYICDCSDGKSHEFDNNQISLVSKYSEVLKSFRKEICSVCV